MNKKGDERVLSIYLFIIYIIVAIGIISGVALFHGAGLDVREVESILLNEKIIDCLVEQGELKEEIFTEDFKLEEFCRLDFKDNSFNYDGEEQIGVRVEFFEFSSCEKTEDKTECLEKSRNTIEVGRTDFLEFCELEGGKIPKCFERGIYVLTKEITLPVLTSTPDFIDPDSVDVSSEGQNNQYKSYQGPVFLRVLSVVGKIKMNT